MCETCIYREGFGWRIKELEDQVRDKHIGFKSYRSCHHGDGEICCRGFWERHKDEFAVGQVAQRLELVEFVDVDTLAPQKELIPVVEVDETGAIIKVTVHNPGPEPMAFDSRLLPATSKGKEK
jgi:hypothetical protein